MRKNAIWLMLLIIICHDKASGSVLKQEVQINNIVVIPQINERGTTHMQISYNALFKNTWRDMLNAKDSSSAFYSVRVLFETKQGMVLAENGYTDFADSGTLASVYETISLGFDHMVAGNKITVPLSALKLDSGLYEMRVVLRVYDKLKKAVSKDYSSDYFKFPMPKKLTLTVMVRQIQVDSFKPNGNTWDYRVFVTKGSEPDVYWTIESGGFKIYKSQMHMNTFNWLDKAGRNDFTLRIVAGDFFTITVMDEDGDLVHDDFIGSFDINTHLLKEFNGDLKQNHFNNVWNMVYAIALK